MNALTPIGRDELLKVDQVAETYGIAPRTVWKYAEKGAIPAPIRFEGLTRWRRSDLNAHIAGLGA